MRLLVFSVVFILSTVMQVAPSWGKDVPMLHFTVENGLPSNTVYDIYRDSHGFLWLATDKGIVRYNGIEFEKFTTNDGLPDNETFFFREDYTGRLWMSCFNGELCYYQNGIFHTAVNTPFLKLPIKLSFPVKIELEQDSSVTITYFTMHEIINIKGNKLKLIKPSYSVKEIQTFPLVANKLSDNRYKVYYQYSNCIIDTSYNIIDNKPNMVNYLYNICGNQGYLYTSYGIYTKNEELLFRITNSTTINSYIYRLGYLDGRWCIATNKGLIIDNDMQLLPDKRITGIMTDVEGNLWLGVLDDGIYELSRNCNKVEKYENVYNGQVKFAHADSGALYFTTNTNNVYRFKSNKSSLIFNYYKNFGAYLPPYRWQDYSRAISSNIVIAGNKYINIERDCPFIIDNITARTPGARRYKGEYIYFSAVKETIEKADSIYVKTTHDVFTMSKSEMFSPLTKSIRIANRYYSKDRILGVVVDNGNAVWYSTFTDVYKVVAGRSLIQKQFGDISFRSMHIAGNYMVGISNKNQLVVAANFDKNISVSRYNTDVKCIWNTLYKLNDSSFLISTDNQYRLLHLHKTADTPRYQVQIIENISLPVQAEYICSNDSFCYFFKNGSITKIPVAFLFVQHSAPRIFFKMLRTRDTSYPITSGMKIRYNESRNISISFSPFSFGSRYVICEYSISKDTTDYWRQVRNNEINLFDPGYGSYTVKVRAKTLSSGTFSSPFVFSFTILKPFWAAWWFIALSASFILISVSLIIRAVFLQRTRKREIMHKNEIKFLRSEYKALNALMNPHFIFNTLNNVQWLVNNGDKMAANHYLRVFSDLVRQNMYNISKELIPLTNEIELVRNYLKLEKLRFKNALNFEINIDSAIDLDGIKVPPLLIQPLVENAIKHGILPGSNPDNLLTIDVYPENGKLYVDIKDNGIGISESQKQSRNLHKSTGIENIRNRIEKLSLMHDIFIAFSIVETQNEKGETTGTLARICINIHE